MGGDMTGAHKKIEKKYPGMTKQKHVKAALRKYNEEDETARGEEVEVDEAPIGWPRSKVIDKVKFPTGGVKKGELSDLEKYNKDLRDKKAKKDDETSEEEVDEAVEKPTDSAMTDLRHMLNRLARK